MKIKNSDRVINITLQRFKKAEKEVKRQKINDYVQETLNRTKDLAREELNDRLYSIYVKGLKYRIDANRGQANIYLVGKIPNELENGLKSFDMKPLILKGRESVVVPIVKSSKGSHNKTKHTFSKTISETRSRVGRYRDYKRKTTEIVYKKLNSRSGIAFRTINRNSPKLSWINSGFPKHNFIQRAKYGTLSNNRHLKIKLIK